MAATSVMGLKTKPDFEKCLERINAWYEMEIIDRAPIRFTAHNSEFTEKEGITKTWPDLKSRWFDAEYQIDAFIGSIKGKKFFAETFPVFWPNLGPEVYSAFYGGELVYREVTAYYTPIVKDWQDIKKLRFNPGCEYYKKIEEMTMMALEKSDGNYWTGYTDIHAGIDCAAAWRNPEQFCMDMLIYPEESKNLIITASADFQRIFDHYDSILKKYHQPSITWMGIPSAGKLHIPSCDFASMISTELYLEFCHPVLVEEVKPMTHNIYHLDGKGVAKHLDYILQVPQINAIQWVQGLGDDQPIMQWVPMIKKIQAAGKGLVIDLMPEELDDFMKAVKPEGILLCIPVEEKHQLDIIKKVERWGK